MQLQLYIATVLLLITAAACQYCPNVPNGLERLRNGVDITKLDLMPLDITADNGFRTPVIDFKCAQKKKTTISGKIYDVPDEVISIENIPSGWLDAESEIYKTSSDITEKMSVNAEVGLISGIFSASGSYKSMQHTITNTSKYIEDVSAYISARKVSLFPYWGLNMSNAAQIYVNRFLPPKIGIDNIAVYKNFIQYFGTHFIQYGKYGGLIRLVLSTDKSYYQGRSDSEVDGQAKGSFFNIISAGGGGSGSKTKIDTKFKSSTSEEVRYYGGDTNLLSKDKGIPKWQPTVSANPWLFGGKLVPLSVFFSGDRKNSIARAVEIHLDIAYLQELQRLLYSFKVKEFLRKKVKALDSEIDALLSKEMPDHIEVQKLGQKIKDNLEAPTWFTDQTKLCYRWYADGDGGQCGGGASQLLCAQPNRMTSVYRDDTDGRGGGCRMSWGIINDGDSPAWFNDVQICYKWRADGDAGQCGGGAKTPLCAKVGSYTNYYRDDTDGRAGGCQMQWKLVIPSTAPLWMQNSQLCFQWYPDGDGGQCSGPSRNLCAIANEYTASYRDDTDGRGGGCRMSWGIKL